MIISLNWLKKYVDINVPTDELVELIGSRLVEVEEAIDLAPKYEKCLIVKVETCEPVDGSDHLSLCQINTGTGDLIQVVCGAPNVHAGMLAVWLPPASVVPETYDTSDPFMLSARKLCGHVSNGMLASVRELGLGDDHDGIIEIEPDSAKPGDSFAEKFGLNDVLLDIENKSLTHRPDCFGVIGFAREIAGILGQPADEWLNNPDSAGTYEEKIASDGDLKLLATIADSELCSRYEAVVLDGFNNNKPKYLTEQDVLLAKSGVRPISPIVDVTNYLMLLTGQPLHAFDYDKLVAVGGKSEPEIIVRAAKSGEKLGLLDGKEIELASGDIVITSNDTPVALAGAMGGANTEIDENTQRIVIESATFNLFNLRGTQFRHGIFSEAITRFTKGQPPALTDPVLRESIVMLTENCGMQQLSEIVDAYPEKITNQPIKLSAKQANSLLGTDYSYEHIEKTLRNVGFGISCGCGKQDACECEFVDIVAPWWRTDIHIAEDIIEEIGRLNGYDNIALDLPTRQFVAPAPDKLGSLKSKIRQTLSAAGANEVLTYSFISEKLLKKVGQDPANSYKIINSISPELQYVRQQIVPSLLEKAYENSRAGFDKFALFEMNQVFWKKDELDDEKVPKQYDDLGFVIVNTNKEDTNYYLAKKYVDELASKFGVKIEVVSRKEPYDVETYFEQKRSADLLVDGQYIGNVAEIKNSVLKKFKLPRGASAIEIGIDLLLKVMNGKPHKTAHSVSQFPNVERDMTFQVNSETQYAELENLLCKTLESQNLQFQCVPISIYQGDDKTTKNISFRLTFASYEKTLSGDEIATIVDKIIVVAKEKLNAEVI